MNDLPTRVTKTCTELAQSDIPITFSVVAERVGVSKATLYRRPELRAVIEEHRLRGREPYSLAGLVVEIDRLHQGLDAVASKVRRHEEDLRKLRRTSTRR